MRKRLLLNLLIAIFICSCIEKSDNGIPTISIDFKTIEPLNAHEQFVVKKITIDPELDTRYGTIINVITYGSDILLHTDHSIYRLDSCGFLKNKISDRGKARNEFLSTEGIFKKDDYVMIAETEKIIKYSLDNQFIDSYDISKFMTLPLHPFGDGYISNEVSFDQGVESFFILYDSTFRKIKRLDNFSKPWYVASLAMYEYNQSKLFIYEPTFEKTVYSIDPNFVCSTKYIVDFGDENFPDYINKLHKDGDYMASSDAMMAHNNKCAKLHGAYMETDVAIYFDILYQKKYS